jgi:hypothetical protein
MPKQCSGGERLYASWFIKLCLKGGESSAELFEMLIAL